ncbi:MAG: hypothetical protein HQK89_06465 [Nitrospirae bacterium]|nr:hypothetical protein [Nitrospirota bacterium]
MLKSIKYLTFTAVFTVIMVGFLTNVEATEVVVVEGSAFKAYEEALQGFTRNCKCNIKEIITLDASRTEPRSRILKAKPDLVLAIGQEALVQVKEISEVPVVYIMALFPGIIPLKADNITGVSMFISPETQLSILVDVFPSMRSIGLLYTPDESKVLAARAESAALRKGIKFFKREIRSKKEIFPALEDIRFKIDAYWILPDKNLVNAEMIEILSVFSMENKIPLLSFTDQHLKFGAAISINVDPFAMGIQAAEIINSSSKTRKDAQNQPFNDAKIAKVSFNRAVITSMDIAINEKYKSDNLLSKEHFAKIK